MKITFVCPYAGLAGGIRVVAIYAERLRQLGHDVLLVSKPKPKPTIKHHLRSLLAGNGLVSAHREPSHFDSIDVPHKVLEKPRPVVDADVPDADVIVATWWQTAEEIANLSPAKGAKAYFIQQHETFEGFPIEKVKATYLSPLHKITISKWLLNLMQTEYGDNDVSLIFNSVDTEQFHAPKREKQRVPTIGVLYHPMFHKGCDVSFKAISIAAQKIPNLQVVAFGAYPPSPDFPAGTQYIQRPAQDKIREIYARCDVWLCGSRSEGFHLPPLEAMACRCPVVSTAVGGPIDIIQDGVNGYLVPVEDYEALADRLVRVLSLSQEDWQAMSDAAYAVATGYTWDDATRLFEKALYTAIHKEMSNPQVAAQELFQCQFSV